MLQLECNRQTCPEMKAGEWLYLCVAHGNDGAMEQCCAIDYILHTIDSATALLQGLFPPNPANRITLANETTVVAPLGGYQYVPVETVEPSNDRSLESWTDCPVSI